MAREAMWYSRMQARLLLLIVWYLLDCDSGLMKILHTNIFLCTKDPYCRADQKVIIRNLGHIRFKITYGRTVKGWWSTTRSY
jgi:hypothetical protein